jgi:hypothetical protein
MPSKKNTEEIPLTDAQKASKAATDALADHAVQEGKLRDAQYDATVAALNERIAEMNK